MAELAMLADRLYRKVVTHPASSLAQYRESSPADTSVLTTILRRQLKSDLVMCYKMLNSQVCVDADAFLLDVLPSHGDIVPNCISLVLCQFVMETFSKTVLLVLGILYLTPLFPHVLLIFLNVNYIQCLFLWIDY